MSADQECWIQLANGATVRVRGGRERVTDYFHEALVENRALQLEMTSGTDVDLNPAHMVVWFEPDDEDRAAAQPAPEPEPGPPTLVTLRQAQRDAQEASERRRAGR